MRKGKTIKNEIMNLKTLLKLKIKKKKKYVHFFRHMKNKIIVNNAINKMKVQNHRLM